MNQTRGVVTGEVSANCRMCLYTENTNTVMLLGTVSLKWNTCRGVRKVFDWRG